MAIANQEMTPRERELIRLTLGKYEYTPGEGFKPCPHCQCQPMLSYSRDTVRIFCATFKCAEIITPRYDVGKHPIYRLHAYWFDAITYCKDDSWNIFVAKPVDSWSSNVQVGKLSTTPLSYDGWTSQLKPVVELPPISADEWSSKI